MSLSAFCIRRFLQAIAIFLGVTGVLFFLFYIVGGDPALMYAGKNADARSIELLREQMGLNAPLGVQFLKFVKEALFCDWGTSWSTQRSVATMVWERLGPTLAITVTGFVLGILFSLVLAFLSHFWRGRKIEKIILFLISCLMSVSFISVILFMQKLLAFDLNLFPIFGWDRGWGGIHYVILPVLIYVVGSISPKFLLFRSVIAEEWEKRYVLTAQSKGLAWSRIYGLHIFKNMWPLMVTVVATQVPALLTHSLLLEIYFGIPGLGHLLLRSIQSGDFPVVKALTVLGASTYIVCLFFSDVIMKYFLPHEDTL